MDAESQMAFLPPRKGKAAETRRALKLMRLVMNGFTHRLDEQLRASKVTTAQLRFLGELKQQPGATGAQLARSCHITPQSAQAMMARAVARGWVVRGKHAENERFVTARLTPAGERLLLHADAILSQLEAEVWAGVPMRDFQLVTAVLSRGLKRL